MRFLKSPLEYVLLILFVLYLILPIQLPESMAKFVETPLGIIGLFLITIALFVYINPILGVLYIFVAYELLRRSARVTGKSAYIEYTPSQIKKDEKMRKMNPTPEKSLEEVVIHKMAPIGENTFVDSRITTEKGNIISGVFQPIIENIHSASLI